MIVLGIIGDTSQNLYRSAEPSRLLGGLGAGFKAAEKRERRHWYLKSSATIATTGPA